MYFVTVYDIATGTASGRRRLYRVEKICKKTGVAVQNSVFECELPADEYMAFRRKLEAIISPSEDSVRFYLLGKHYEKRVESIGRKVAPWDRKTYVV